MKLATPAIASFQKFIWNYYQENQRFFAWRNIEDPYKVLVSEIMLQQTQTYRVIPKYELWITEFPDFVALAKAPLRQVLSTWQGLGYNRRALALQKIAQKVVAEYGAILPADPDILMTFPGIGPNTAGSVCAFAFNVPTVFIETNIRTVFIHSFFKEKDAVHDKEILPLVEQTLDSSNPRAWYYALMDYGVHLKQTHKNPSRKSVHHAKQSKFEGSHRQIRGGIIRALSQHSQLTLKQFSKALERPEEEVIRALEELLKEHFLVQQGDCFLIKE